MVEHQLVFEPSIIVWYRSLTKKFNWFCKLGHLKIMMYKQTTLKHAESYPNVCSTSLNYVILISHVTYGFQLLMNYERCTDILFFMFYDIQYLVLEKKLTDLIYITSCFSYVLHIRQHFIININHSQNL